MLKKIPKILSPELVKILMEMGHGDEIVLADGNFPSESIGQRTTRADGHGGRDVVVDDGLQNLKLSLVQVHVSSGSFPALSGILLALRFAEC